MLQPYAPILLLSGPTGCGKTTTLNILCKFMQIQVSEWVNPIDKDFEYERSTSQTSRLLEFLSVAKYPSLFDTCGKWMTLVEDFPNSVIHNPSEFVGILE